LRKILVTGSGGMLGADLVAAGIAQGFEIIPCGRNDFDIADPVKTRRIIACCKPDCVVHPAAFTDVDGCEIDKNKAVQVNVEGTANIVSVCDNLNIPMVFFSSDYVFDGHEPQGYDECSSPAPLNFYGATKLEAENIIKQNLKEFLIVRTSWLFGRNGKNFVKTITEKAAKEGKVWVVDDQIGSPTYSKDLAEAVFHLIRDNKTGIFHLTNSETCSWYQFTLEILNLLKIECRVNPISSKDSDRAAKRPAYSVLKNTRWLNEGYLPLRSYQDALKDYLGGC